MLSGDIHDRIDIGWLAIQVDGYDGPGPFSDGRRERVWVEIVCPRVWLDRNDLGSNVGNGQPRSDVSVVRHDDLISRPQAHRPHRQVKGVEAIGYADAVLHTNVCGEFLLERLELVPKQVPTAEQHAGDRLPHSVFQFAVCGADIE